MVVVVAAVVVVVVGAVAVVAAVVEPLARHRLDASSGLLLRPYVPTLVSPLSNLLCTNVASLSLPTYLSHVSDARRIIEGAWTNN